MFYKYNIFIKRILWTLGGREGFISEYLFSEGPCMYIEQSDIVRKGCMSKGKQPRTRVNKVPKFLLSEIKGVFILNGQKIGLEAVIFWRSRNRALVYFKSCFNDDFFQKKNHHECNLKDKSTDNLTDLNNIPIPCICICYIF